MASGRAGLERGRGVGAAAVVIRRTVRRSGAWGLLAPLPLILTIALTALEMLVAVLQAYVFAVLTCVYLNDAVHGGHH